VRENYHTIITVFHILFLIFMLVLFLYLPILMRSYEGHELPLWWKLLSFEIVAFHKSLINFLKFLLEKTQSSSLDQDLKPKKPKSTICSRLVASIGYLGFLALLIIISCCDIDHDTAVFSGLACCFFVVLSRFWKIPKFTAKPTPVNRKTSGQSVLNMGKGRTIIHLVLALLYTSLLWVAYGLISKLLGEFTLPWYVICIYACVVLNLYTCANTISQCYTKICISKQDDEPLQSKSLNPFNIFYRIFLVAFVIVMSVYFDGFISPSNLGEWYSMFTLAYVAMFFQFIAILFDYKKNTDHRIIDN
jgi:hypothetical protein